MSEQISTSMNLLFGVLIDNVPDTLLYKDLRLTCKSVQAIFDDAYNRLFKKWNRDNNNAAIVFVNDVIAAIDKEGISDILDSCANEFYKFTYTSSIPIPEPGKYTVRSVPLDTQSSAQCYIDVLGIASTFTFIVSVNENNVYDGDEVLTILMHYGNNSEPVLSDDRYNHRIVLEAELYRSR